MGWAEGGVSHVWFFGGWGSSKEGWVSKWGKKVEFVFGLMIGWESALYLECFLGVSNYHLIRCPLLRIVMWVREGLFLGMCPLGPMIKIPVVACSSRWPKRYVVV